MAERCSCCKRWEEHICSNRLKRCKFHFFKVLLNDFSYQLSIPRKFVILFQEKLPETVELKAPTGRRWHVKLKKAGGCIFLEDGWDRFVRDNSLEVGDFLVFRFNGDSCFKVLIFDASGCEKDNPYSCDKRRKGHFCDENPVKGEAGGEYFAASSQLVSIPTRAIGFDDVAQAALPQAINLAPRRRRYCSRRGIKILREDGSLQKDVEEASKQAIRPEMPRPRDGSVHPDEQDGSKYLKGMRRSGRLSTRAGYDAEGDANLSRALKYLTSYPQQFISNRRAVTKEEKKRAFQLASAVQLTHPAFMSIMKPSHVYRKFFLTVPLEFASEFFHERTQGIILQTAGGEWKVRCTQYNKIFAISHGWREFVAGNNLEEGDVLIFEFARRRSHERMNVRIFRVVEDVVQPSVVGAAPPSPPRRRWTRRK